MRTHTKSQWPLLWAHLLCCNLYIGYKRHTECNYQLENIDRYSNFANSCLCVSVCVDCGLANVKRSIVRRTTYFDRLISHLN